MPRQGTILTLPGGHGGGSKRSKNMKKKPGNEAVRVEAMRLAEHYIRPCWVVYMRRILGLSIRTRVPLNEFKHPCPPEYRDIVRQAMINVGMYPV
jgi:hypothetical protein